MFYKFTFYNYIIDFQNVGENGVNLITYSHIEFISITRCHDKHFKKNVQLGFCISNFKQRTMYYIYSINGKKNNHILFILVMCLLIKFIRNEVTYYCYIHVL